MNQSGLSTWESGTSQGFGHFILGVLTHSYWLALLNTAREISKVPSGGDRQDMLYLILQNRILYICLVQNRTHYLVELDMVYLSLKDRMSDQLPTWGWGEVSWEFKLYLTLIQNGDFAQTEDGFSQATTAVVDKSKLNKPSGASQGASLTSSWCLLQLLPPRSCLEFLFWLPLMMHHKA